MALANGDVSGNDAGANGAGTNGDVGGNHDGVVNRFGSNGVGNDASNARAVMALSGFWFALFAFELSVQLCPPFLCLCKF